MGYGGSNPGIQNWLDFIIKKGIQDKNSVAYFWLINFSLLFTAPLTSAAKSNEELVNQWLRNADLILEAL